MQFMLDEQEMRQLINAHKMLEQLTNRVNANVAGHKHPDIDVDWISDQDIVNTLVGIRQTLPDLPPHYTVTLA